MKIFDNKTNKDMRWSELSKKGGEATKSKHGSQYYSEIAKKGRKIVALKDPDYFKNLAAQGLAARKKKKEKEASSVHKLTKILSGQI